MTAEPDAAPAIPAEPERLPVTAWPGTGALMDEHPEWGYLAEPYAPASLTIIDPDLWQACGGSAEREPAPLPKRNRGPMSGDAEDVTGADDKSGPQQCVESRTGPGHPEDATHDETCCMNGVPPSAGPHPDCPGRPSPTAAASAEDQAQDAADAHQRDSEAVLARWGTARCYPCSRDKCTECEGGTCGCAHPDAADLAAITADHDGEVMPDEPGPGRAPKPEDTALVTAPRPDLSDHAPSAVGDERQEGPGRPGEGDEFRRADEPDRLDDLTARYDDGRDNDVQRYPYIESMAAEHGSEFEATTDLPRSEPVDAAPLAAPGDADGPGQAVPRPDDSGREPGRGARDMRDRPWANGGPFLAQCCDDVPPQALHSHVHAPDCDNALCHGCVPSPDEAPNAHAGFWSPRDPADDLQPYERPERCPRHPDGDRASTRAGGAYCAICGLALASDLTRPASGDRHGDDTESMTRVIAPVAESLPARRSRLPWRKPREPEHKPRHASHGDQERRT